MTTIEECVAEAVKQVMAEAIGKLSAKLDALEQLRTGPSQMLYREAEAAKLLGLSRETIKRWRNKGKVSAHTPRGTRVPLYSRENLEVIFRQLATGELTD